MWKGHILAFLGAHFQRLLTSLHFFRCFLFLACGNFLSVCSISSVSFSTVLCEGGGHRKITIIIEDPVAGWQCSFTVLHVFLDPSHPLLYFSLHGDKRPPSLFIFKVHNMCLWLFFLLFCVVSWCDEAINDHGHCRIVHACIFHNITFCWGESFDLTEVMPLSVM